MSKNITNNQRPTINVIDSASNTPFTVKGNSSDGSLFVDIQSGGAGGVQYTDGGVPPAHPVGNTIEWSDGSNWQTVSTAKPLPVTASFSPSGTQDINLKQVGGSTISIGQQLAAASLPVILPSATITTLTPPSNSGYALDSSLTTIDTDLKSNITLHAGTNVIGHVITDSGSTTAVTGTVTISGAVTETTLDAALIAQETTTSSVKGLTAFGAVTTNAPTYTTAKSDALSLTTAGALRSDITTIAGTAPTTAGFIDIKGADGNVFVRQAAAANLNATVVGTGTFAVQATLAAETTKAIGVTRTADGAGNLLTSNSTTPSAHFALDQNITSILGTAPTTVGKLDVKGADGDIFVRQATAANLNATVTGQATGSAVPANAFYNAGDAATALPTAASAGNLTGAMYDKFGRQVVLPVTIRDLVGTQTTTISASTSETTIVTQTASTFCDLMLLVISNTSASTTTRIDFRDTTAGSILFSLFSPAADTRGFSLGGIAIPQTSVNTNWTAQCATSTTDIRIYAVFAKNK